MSGRERVGERQRERERAGERERERERESGRERAGERRAGRGKLRGAALGGRGSEREKERGAQTHGCIVCGGYIRPVAEFRGSVGAPLS